MKLIFGLGNPGKEYNKTRHNVGFMILDYFLGEVKWQKKHESLFFEMQINEEKVVFIKPQTYMNLSGKSVLRFIKYYKVPLENILVIHDDLDLDVGRYKIKTDSGSGGNNGINSIIEHLKTKKFSRLKVGISNNKLVDTRDFVLSKFNKTEMLELENIFEKAKNIIKTFCESDIEGVLDRLSIEEKNEIS